MNNQFFERPIRNSPYEYPTQYWELDEHGQPTQRIIEGRRKAEFITPIPKPRKSKEKASQSELVFPEGKGLSTEDQQYELTSVVINELRYFVDQWRSLSNPNDWTVTPDTQRLLQHWRHHKFSDIRPFFCQIEAVETAIWLTEVAPQMGKTGKRFLEHLANANENANPELMRLALKLATGAGKTTVMAMIIAWQTINYVRQPGSNKFTRGSPTTPTATTKNANWFPGTCSGSLSAPRSSSRTIMRLNFASVSNFPRLAVPCCRAEVRSWIRSKPKDR